MYMLREQLESGCNSRSSRGFSLLEMVIVIALIIVLASISFISMVPVMKQQRVTNAYNTVLAAMRQARDNAIAQRTSYSVTFSATTTPNTITIAPTLVSGFQGQQSAVTYQMPTDVSFQAAGPVSSTPPPDGYGIGANAIDFGYTSNGVGTGGQSVIYFCPDGSAQDAENGAGNCAGSADGGVVYLSRSGDVLSSRAISVWGSTGRMRGWRLYPKTGGGYQWVRQ
jgi:prepilin-type N-terminal cleavage/methylation domain-containing protein